MNLTTPTDRARETLERMAAGALRISREILDDAAFDIDRYFEQRCDCMNDLIVLRGGKAGCLKCGGNSESGKQVWRCMCCGTCRVWGLDFPFCLDPAELNCIRCGTVRPHRFMLVTRGQ